MTKVNYVTQLLISKNNTAKGHKAITIDEINYNFQRCLNTLGDPARHKDRILREETVALIKLAYIQIMATIESLYGEDMPEGSEEFDKIELKGELEESSERLKEEILVEEQENAENGRVNNEYKKLKIPLRCSLDEVRTRYLEIMKAWNFDLDRQISQGKYDLEQSRKQEKLIREQLKSFELLSDSEYKIRLDELMLFNFSPNQEKLYSPGYMSEATCLPEKPRRVKNQVTGEEYLTLPSFKFGNIYGGDDVETVIMYIANIGLGRWRKKESDKVTYRAERITKRYLVSKRYRDRALAESRKKKTMQEDAISTWDELTDSEVFRVTGDLHENLLMEPEIDINLIKYTHEVMLSLTNLEEAIRHNGEYIGQVGLTNDKEDYIVFHEKEALCASKELQKARAIAKARSKEDIEKKAIVYQLDKGKIELYDKDPITGKIYKEVMSATTPVIPINPIPPTPKLGGRTGESDEER